MLFGRGAHRHTSSHIVWMLAVPALLLSIVSATADAADARVRIHRYSDFHVSATAGKPVGVAPGVIARGRTQVNVYGKRFTLDLEDNARLTDQLPVASHQMALLRGTVEGKSGSWARMTQTTEGMHGLIWDGAELYAVEPGSAVTSALAVSLPEPGNTVIFRLSDTTLDLGAEYCGSAEHTGEIDPHTGLATYQAITAELGEQLEAAGTPVLRLEMQALADAAFRAQYSSDRAALEAIMVRLNNVDGIFSAQVGLEVQATDVQIYAADPASLTQSTDAGTLLSALGQLRQGNPVMGTYGVTHLFTGRDLDGQTLGIAYIGNICGARYGASLSEIRNRGAWIDSLVAAHELGHQLGAVHDGTGACGGTPAQSYLMGEQINGSSALSQCSRETILATMKHAACLVPVGAPDMSLSTDISPIQAAPDTSFSWALPVQNLGTGTADQPTVHMALPAGLLVESSAIAGGSCVAVNNDMGGSVDCLFDVLAANETRLLELKLRAGKAGSYQISVDVGAVSDNNPINNHAVYQLAVATTDTAPANSTATVSAQPASNTSDGTGGGAFNALGLLSLALAASWRRRSRQHAV